LIVKEEKKNREAEAKRKRLEEAERKRQAMMQAMQKQKESVKPNYVISRKEGGAQGVGNSQVPLIFFMIINFKQFEPRFFV